LIKTLTSFPSINVGGWTVKMVFSRCNQTGISEIGEKLADPPWEKTAPIRAHQIASKDRDSVKTSG
jgi:hypothetical protein